MQVHKRIHFKFSVFISDLQGCIVMVSGSLFYIPVVLINIYNPNWDVESFIKKFILTYFRFSPCLVDIGIALSIQL